MPLIGFALLARASWTDLRFRKIRNRDLVWFEIAQLILLGRFHLWLGVVTIATLLFLRFCSKGGLGYGDVKLLAVLATWSNSASEWVTLLGCAFCAGGLVAIVGGLSTRRWRASFPFAPMVFSGALFAWMLGH